MGYVVQVCDDYVLLWGAGYDVPTGEDPALKDRLDHEGQLMQVPITPLARLCSAVLNESLFRLLFIRCVRVYRLSLSFYWNDGWRRITLL